MLPWLLLMLGGIVYAIYHLYMRNQIFKRMGIDGKLLMSCGCVVDELWMSC